MENVRKALGALLMLLGAYYCMLAVVTLATLPRVTATWIQRSGDPDFKYDAGLFTTLLATGAVLVLAFGLRTTFKGAREARGHSESWLGLAIGAFPLHWVWFLYRVIGDGILGREAQAAAARNNALWFGVVCLAYVAMGVLTRRRGGTSRQAADVTRGFGSATV